MDPIQLQVMKFMPVMISVLFIWLPSGLVLYSVANAGISLIQQMYLYKQLGASLSE
jgi:YidC/Oxa1 family membrane protein insertase